MSVYISDENLPLEESSRFIPWKCSDSSSGSGSYGNVRAGAMVYIYI